MLNRRVHVRVLPKTHEPLEVQLMGADFMDRFRVADISIGGLGLHVPHGFQGCSIDETIDIVLKLPNERSFMARGQIRHRSPNSPVFGVEFTSLKDEDKKRVEAYIARRVAEGGELRQGGR